MAKQSEETNIAVIASNIERIKTDIIDINKKLSDKYPTMDQLALTNDRLQRIERIVYGLIALILSGLVGAWLTGLIGNK